MLHFEIGDAAITEIIDMPHFEIPLATLFPESDPTHLAGDMAWLSPDFINGGLVRLVVRSWLLQLNGRTILIDACVGDHKDRPIRPEWHQRNQGEWMSGLARCGLTPEDIDVVFCTHLHADHVGWNTKLEDGRWVPTFPNARYVTSRIEFEFWQHEVARQDGPVGHGSFQDSVLPVMEAGRMDLVDGGLQLEDGLVLHPSPGHTPGHMSLDLRRGGQRGYFCGDAIHSPVQIVMPEWSSAFCTDPERARTTRMSILETLSETDDSLIPMHFGGAARCRIVRNGSAYRPEFG